MYSTKNLKNIKFEFDTIKYYGQQILKTFEKQLEGLPGIENLKNKGSSLRFDLFDTPIVIRIELPPKGLEIAGELCIYFKIEGELKKIELPGITFINDVHLMIEGNEVLARQGMTFILDNIIPTIFNSRRVVFKNDIAEDPDSKIK